MLDKSASTARRCENRYTIEDSQSTHVTVSYTDDDGQHVHHGRLADLSTHGVRFSLDAHLDTDSIVSLQIRVPCIDLDVTWRATIRWLQPRDAESWWVGCELDDPIPGQMIHELAMAKLLNRRRDPRYKISQMAQAKWELADQIIDVEVVDFSKGGFCMTYSEANSFPNERVMLFLPTDDGVVKIPARVMWQRKNGDKYALGCAFSTMDGFMMFRNVVEPGHKSKLYEFRSRPRTVTRWVAIAIVVLMSVKGLQMISSSADAGQGGGIQQLMQTVTGLFRPGAESDAPDSDAP